MNLFNPSTHFGLSANLLFFFAFENSKLGILYVLLSQASMVKLPENEDTPEKRVNRIFNQMDTVLDTLLTLDLIKDPQL